MMGKELDDGKIGTGKLDQFDGKNPWVSGVDFPNKTNPMRINPIKVTILLVKPHKKPSFFGMPSRMPGFSPSNFIRKVCRPHRWFVRCWSSVPPVDDTMSCAMCHGTTSLRPSYRERWQSQFGAAPGAVVF